MPTIHEPARTLPTRDFDVVIAGGGTAGLVAAVAAARTGARTALVESKGYVGGIAVEGGTALHSFYNLWKAFPGVPKRQVVRGIAQEIIDRLAARGGTTGHAEMSRGFDYDCVCTAIDVELYKLVAFEMLAEAGVNVFVNTLLVGAAKEERGASLTAAIVESRSGREAFTALTFVDTTGYADLSAFAGATFTEPNDYHVANSIGVGGVSMEGYHQFLESCGALTQQAEGPRGGKANQIVRLDGDSRKFPPEFAKEMHAIGLSPVTTSVHDGYFMFLKLNLKLPVSPTSRDAVAVGEHELRRRQEKAVQLFRRFVPGCQNAFIARSSPSLCIRRGRLVTCDYDIPLEDILNAHRCDDEIMIYGFHDSAPRLQIKDGGVYGLPYRALRPVGLDNLLVAGMMITSNQDAHMSTRNTVCVMGQGQAVGTAAALCAQQKCTTRELPYAVLRQALAQADVCFDA